MKNKKLYFLGMSVVMMVFSFSIPASAVEEIEVNTFDDSKMIRIELTSPASKAINVVLYDRADRVVYNDKIPAGSTFENEFDFSTVRKGKYSLVTQLGGMNYIRIIDVNNSGIKLSDSYYAFEPQHRTIDNILKVHFMNVPQEQVRINIQTSWGTIYEDYYGNPGLIFSKNYKLKDFPAGTYTFNLASDREDYSFDFEVK